MNSEFINYLLRFYPGARIDEITSNVYFEKDEKAKLRKGNSSLDLEYDNNIYGINRGYKFSNKDKYLINEVIRNVKNIQNTELGMQYFSILMERIFDDVVFDYFFDAHNDRNKLNITNYKNILDSISYWRNKTYENKNVTFGLVIESSTEFNNEKKYMFKNKVNLLNIFKKEYIAPLSDGINTFIRISSDGTFIGMEQVNAFDEKSELPYRFSSISKYYSERIIILTRLGDILLITNGNIDFIKKDKQWIQYNANRISSRLTEQVGISNSILRKAVYLTCLDVSLAKTGGVIGIVKRSKFELQSIISQEILKNPEYQEKMLFFSTITMNRKFHEIDRLIRKELVGVDGSLIIDTEGNIISVGTIVKIEGGSLSGGRTAATILLSRFGIGIKISSDGYIAAYHDGQLDPVLKIE